MPDAAGEAITTAAGDVAVVLVAMAFAVTTVVALMPRASSKFTGINIFGVPDMRPASGIDGGFISSSLVTGS